MSFMMNKLAMNNTCEIILENFFFAKNHCKIQVHAILVCALYLIKYGDVLSKVFISIIIVSNRDVQQTHLVPGPSKCKTNSVTNPLQK
jgi:hypothetical protein